ncbi:IS66 family transposase zinc-finger binding domain-containing protein [Burkholderia oklahomensis]|uniref:IS66 family transposase zinc-finger binding domain-containing protein n=1 Tax=Burkholderia oklahomensis TaxID=342113 RepID=UPI000AB54D9D
MADIRVECGDRRWCRGGAEARAIDAEASERLGVIPEQIRVIRHPRIECACACCDLGI